MVTGNKGEWSELYVLLKLLAEGKLYAADDNVERIDNMYFPVLAISRKEVDKIVEYDIPDYESSYIVVHLNDVPIKTIDRSKLSEEAKVLYDKILEGGDHSFAITSMNDIMEDLLYTKLAAPSTNKTDLKLHLHDIQTGFEQLSGFSVKSELGKSPTLLNASKATNFVYKVTGLSAEEMCRINDINTPKRIIDRMNKILESGELSYEGMVSDKFSDNLTLLDIEMDRLLAEALLIYYSKNISSCEDVVKELEELNPLGIRKKGFYEYKFKKFLCSIALGMVPAKDWDGHDESTGGYIIVNKKGDVLAYHIYNRDKFETYLMKNTRFEKGSTARHDYASIYKRGDEMFINLNLQIRFK